MIFVKMTILMTTFLFQAAYGQYPYGEMIDNSNSWTGKSPLDG